MADGADKRSTNGLVLSLRKEADGTLTLIADYVESTDARWPYFWKARVFVTERRLPRDFLSSDGIDSEIALDMGEIALAYLRARLPSD